jgi:hypothetical protein
LRGCHRIGLRWRFRHLEVDILIQIGDVLSSLGISQVIVHTGCNFNFILSEVGGFHRTDAKLYDLLVGEPQSLNIELQRLALFRNLHRTPGH